MRRARRDGRSGSGGLRGLSKARSDEKKESVRTIAGDDACGSACGISMTKAFDWICDMPSAFAAEAALHVFSV